MLNFEPDQDQVVMLLIYYGLSIFVQISSLVLICIIINYTCKRQILISSLIYTFTLYILGTILEQSSFCLITVLDYEKEQNLVPMYFFSETLMLSSMIIVMNKANHTVGNSYIKPFFCINIKVKSENTQFLIEWFLYTIPNALFIVLAIVGCTAFKNSTAYAIIVDGLDMCYSVFLCVIIIFMSVRYSKKTQSSHTNMGVLMTIIAVVAVLDSFITHCFICIFNLISDDAYLEQQI